MTLLNRLSTLRFNLFKIVICFLIADMVLTFFNVTFFERMRRPITRIPFANENYYSDYQILKNGSEKISSRPLFNKYHIYQHRKIWKLWLNFNKLNPEETQVLSQMICHSFNTDLTSNYYEIIKTYQDQKISKKFFCAK